MENATKKMSDEPWSPVTQDQIRRVRKSLGLNEETINQTVENINAWLKMQPHLPKCEDDGRLERWLIRCKNSVEKVKQTLDSYYTLKTLTPEILSGWDVHQPWIDVVNKHGYLCVMPELTPELDRISILGALTPVVDSNYNVYDVVKFQLLLQEIRMNEDYNLKEVYILDMKHLSPSHLTHFTLPAMKKFETCLMRGYNARVRSIHVVNMPPFAQMFVNLIKSVLKSKIASRVHVHGTDFTELHKHVPKSHLPKELGGDCGTIDEHFSRLKKKVISYHAWFLKQEKLRSDESKRPTGQIISSEMFGFDGSFRKLTID